ncbi:MAG: hypothetical protein ACLGH0_11145 [Thermoanaerobaculia bacterium]
MFRKLALVAVVLTQPLFAQEPIQKLEEATANVRTMIGRLERHVDANVQFLRDLDPCTAPTSSVTPASTEAERIPAELDAAYEELERTCNAVHEMVKPQSPSSFREAARNALIAADELLTNRRDASLAANWLRRVAAERRESSSHQDLCRLLESIAPLPRPFTLEELKRDPLVPLRRIDEAVRRQVLHRNNALQRGEWSLGLGVMWTPMKVNGETRAGQPIATVAFRPLPEDLPIFRDASIRPWVQVGAGLQFDEPSFYVGCAIDVGPYVHLGVGWTAQDVGDEFDGDLYVGMTIRLEKLRGWLRE